MTDISELVVRQKNAAPVDVEAIRSRWAEQGYNFKETTDDPGRVWHWESHEAEQVAAIVRGRLRMDLEGGSLDLEAGDEAFIPNSAWHRAVNPYTEPCDWVYGYRWQPLSGATD
jgi:mannose-6-phosphate isomerase-like protein (cupin superfamily)